MSSMPCCASFCTIRARTVEESNPKPIAMLDGTTLGTGDLLPVSSLAGKLGRSFIQGVRSNAAPMLQGYRARLNPLAMV